VQYKKMVAVHNNPKTKGKVNNKEAKVMDRPRDFHWNWLKEQRQKMAQG